MCCYEGLVAEPEGGEGGFSGLGLGFSALGLGAGGWIWGFSVEGLSFGG